MQQKKKKNLKMQFSAECIILALPFECNFQITWQKIKSWEKSISGVKPHWQCNLWYDDDL